MSFRGRLVWFGLVSQTTVSRKLIIQKLSVRGTVQFKTLNSQIKVTKGKKRDRKFSTN